jgi:hypothetical protein
VSHDVVVGMRLLDAAKAHGFVFQRIAPGPDGPIEGVRENDQWRHVLQPLLLGRAVNLHPLAVVLAIAAGLLAAGIVGALLAVPLLAVLNAGIRSLLSEGNDRPLPTGKHTGQPEEPKPEKPSLDSETT